MSNRRSLVEGLKSPTGIDAEAETRFVLGDKPPAEPETPATPRSQPSTATPAGTVYLVPITTRLKPELADALKRASLERQLARVRPNTVQDIIEEAVEPWLRANGYLP